jgi:hypothetical protein
MFSKSGSSGKRRPQCCNHPSVVLQIAFARQWRDAKNSLTLRHVWRLVPPPAPLLGGTEWGTALMRIPLKVGDIRMIRKSSGQQHWR